MTSPRSAGCSIAVREEGAVHVVARGRPFDERLKQLEHLSRLFQPLIYDHDDYDKISLSTKTILNRREEKWARLLHNRIFREVAEAVAPESSEAIAKLQEDLSARARLSYLDDQDTRRTTVLHADRNQDVQRAAISTSIGLTLCELMLGYGLANDQAGQDRNDLKYALARVTERVKDFAESNGDGRDIEALNRICALLRIVLDAEQ
jgi:hypothetical protein